MKLSSLKTLLVAFLVGLISINAFGQAKKPRLVVIPSDALMQSMGMLEMVDDMGATATIPNYSKAFIEDYELGECIRKISEIFKDRGFGLTMLESELKRVRGKNLVIPVDIKLELGYKIERDGPRQKLHFSLSAVDAYSSVQVAASSGESKPAIGETKVNLLHEAVIDKIDKFILDIDEYFNEMVETGRETRLTVEADGVELPEELEVVVEDWMNENCVRGSFTIDEVDETVLRASQAKMPLFDAAGKALDARGFYRGLAAHLGTKFPTLSFRAKSDSKSSTSGGGTLGDAFILVKEKAE